MPKKTNGRSEKSPGALIAIGGHEDKQGKNCILEEVARRVGAAPLVIATVASEAADQMWDSYHKVFKRFGVKRLSHLKVDARPEANDAAIEIVKGAGGVFFTGGDQLRITSRLGGTALCDTIHDVYRNGGVIAGTSAGASVLTETMMVSGADRSHRIGDNLMLAPGLGFLSAVVIDQHFAERGRVGRLVAVVAQNPRALGVGIDEDTAVVIEGGREFRVMGAGAVYVVDGRGTTHSNVSEQRKDQTLSVFDVRLHLLSDGDCFDLEQRQPVPAPIHKREDLQPEHAGQEDR